MFAEYKSCFLPLNWNKMEYDWLIEENFEKNVVLTTKYVQIVQLEHLLCPKVGGGHKPTCAPTFESGGHVPPPAPFSYALE